MDFVGATITCGGWTVESSLLDIKRNREIRRRSTRRLGELQRDKNERIWPEMGELKM